MPHTLLNKCCVRTAILIDGERVNQGTGVILKHEDKHFVLTAEHCIHGDAGQYRGLDTGNIILEYQTSYDQDEFIPLVLKGIADINERYDWALLEIEDPKMDCDHMDVLVGEKFLTEEPVYFRGYQGINSGTPRTWDAKVIDLGEDEFKISLTQKTFSQAGTAGATAAKGLSGSGVFIIRAKTVYLIGHLKSVVGTKALNDDIHCCRATNFKNKLAKTFVDLGDIDNIRLWEKAAERKITEEDVKSWIQNNDKHFNDLLRKTKVLTSDEVKAEEMARRRILSFLDREYRNHNISGWGNLISQYNETSKSFEESVRDLFTRTVDNANEAKDLLRKLEAAFMEHIKDLVGDKSNKQTIELARHKVTWWLMNCSFDFRD